MSKPTSRKIADMHEAYGKCTGKCRDCCNFTRHTYRRTYHKCKAYGESSCNSTDWVGRNEACGLFNIPFENLMRNPLIESIKRQRTKKTIEPLDGQIRIGDTR